MKDYRIWLKARSALSLTRPAQLAYANVTVLVTNLMERPDTALPEVQVGLNYQVSLRAKTIDEAFDVAIHASAHVNGVLCAAHGAAIDDPVPVLALDWDRADADREFGQIVRDLPLSVIPRRILREDRLVTLLEGWERLSETNGDREKVARALGLLRRSHVESDLVDQFEDLWDGLEVINSIIKDKYSLPKTFRGRKCPKCGELLEVPGSASGIRYAVVELLKEPAEHYKELNALRKDIVHGLGTSGDVLARVRPGIELARRALLVSLLDVMDIPPTQRVVFLRNALPISTGPEVHIRATLRDLPVSQIESSQKIPYFEIEFAETARSGNPGQLGTKSVTFDISAKIHNFDGRLENYRQDLMVAKDPDDANAAIKRHGPRVKRNA
jgi:hypothetical protein